MFLAPFTLIGLALLALPVAIHLLVRRRGRRLDFPSLRFLRETPSFRLHPRRIRQPLLLALRMIALVLLVLGFARPLISTGAGTRRTRIILIDASLSMLVRGRAEAAREQASAIVSKLADDERAALVSFTSGRFTLLAPVTSDKGKLSQALNAYQPTGGSADYRAAMTQADRLLRQEPPGTAQIELISDFQQSGFGELAPLTTPRARINAFPVGTEIERNAFIVDENLTNGEKGIELDASEIISEKDGRSGARRSWMIDTRENALSDIEWRTETNNQITGRLRALAPDDFDADDERFFAFSPPARNAVLLVESDAEGAVYLRAALEAATRMRESSRLKLDRRNELPASAGELNEYALVVLTLHGAPVPSEICTLVDYARAGGKAWLTLGRDIDTASWNAFALTEDGRELPMAALTRASGNQSLSFGMMDADAPVLRLFDKNNFDALRSVRVRVGAAITPRAGSSTLMRWNDNSPAFVSARIGDGEMLVLATSTERAASDLGLSAAFPVLTTSILRDAIALPEALSKNIGEPVYLDTAPETSVKITNAEGRTQQTEARLLVQNSSGFFDMPGIYRLEYSGRTLFMAFNSPAKESERTLASSDQIRTYFPEKADEPGMKGAVDVWRDVAERYGNVWRYLFIASFLLLIAELIYAMRQRQVAVVSSGEATEEFAKRG